MDLSTLPVTLDTRWEGCAAGGRGRERAEKPGQGLCSDAQSEAAPDPELEVLPTHMTERTPKVPPAGRQPCLQSLSLRPHENMTETRSQRCVCEANEKEPGHPESIRGPRTIGPCRDIPLMETGFSEKTRLHLRVVESPTRRTHRPLNVCSPSPRCPCSTVIRGTPKRNSPFLPTRLGAPGGQERGSGPRTNPGRDPKAMPDPTMWGAHPQYGQLSLRQRRKEKTRSLGPLEQPEPIPAPTPPWRPS